jgi:adenosine/AMP kinase
MHGGSVLGIADGMSPNGIDNNYNLINRPKHEKDIITFNFSYTGMCHKIT